MTSCRQRCRAGAGPRHVRTRRYRLRRAPERRGSGSDSGAGQRGPTTHASRWCSGPRDGPPQIRLVAAGMRDRGRSCLRRPPGARRRLKSRGADYAEILERRVAELTADGTAGRHARDTGVIVRLAVASRLRAGSAARSSRLARPVQRGRLRRPRFAEVRVRTPNSCAADSTDRVGTDGGGSSNEKLARSKIIGGTVAASAWRCANRRSGPREREGRERDASTTSSPSTPMLPTSTCRS